MLVSYLILHISYLILHISYLILTFFVNDVPTSFTALWYILYYLLLRGGNEQLKQRCFIFFVLLFHFHEEYYIDEINIMTSSYTRGRFLLLRGKSFSFTSRKNSRTERLTDKNVNACLSCSWFGNNAAPTEQFFSAA